MLKNSSSNHRILNLKNALSSKRDEVVKTFQSTHSHAQKWLSENQVDLKNIRKKSKKVVASTALAASLLLSPPPDSDILTPHEIRNKLLDHGYIGVSDMEVTLSERLKPLVDFHAGHAPQEDDQKIRQIIQEELGIGAASKFDGQQLNHSIGWMGYEQHLKRYPGDTIEQHDEEQIAGIAPGLGAWGYFTYSKSDFDQEDYLREKYYFAVQTLYLPTWKSDLRHLVKWYKHRKMIAINPENGKAVVGVIADAGPAKFTGKHFGGSPEVMTHLRLIYGKKKGKVILYFVDDPNDEIPLGPVRSHHEIANSIQEI